VNVQKLIRRSGVKLFIAGKSTSGTLESFVSVGRPKNQIRINDSRGTQQITDFETAASGINEQITEGRTVSMTWTANLVVDDPGFKKIETLYCNDARAWLKIEATALDGTTKKTWVYTGFVSDLSVTFNESGVAEVSVTFAADAVWSLVTVNGVPLRDAQGRYLAIPRVV